MPGLICSHCGERNAADEHYCQNCGALLPSPEDAEPGPASSTAAGPEPAAFPAVPLAHTEPDDNSGPEPAVGIGQLAGLIPEREAVQSFLYQETASPPRTHQDRDALPLLSLEATAPGRRLTGSVAGMTLRRHYMLFWLLGLAALIPFWLPTASSPPAAQTWEGVEEARLLLEALEPGSQILVYWQNEPGVAGELDLAAIPVLQQVLLAGVELHVLSQHPLGLPQFSALLRTIQADLQAANMLHTDLDKPETVVHRLGFWPGGYVVLPHIGPWLQSTRPDLQLIVTPHPVDVLHWLELVAPFTDAPAVIVTSAGTGQVIRPYLDTGQVAGLISGYDGAFQYTSGSETPVVPAAYGSRMARHFAAQNWIPACLILVILITILFRDQPALPWTSPRV